MKQKLFSIMITLSMLFCTTIPSSAVTPSIDSSIESYVLEQIQTIQDTDPLCSWNDNTSISSVTTLYNLDNAPNGYILYLSTNGIQNGFIQLHYVDGNYSLYCYAFNGLSEVDCMSEHWGYELSNANIYFLGSLKYLILTTEGYLDLASNSVVNLNMTTLQNLEESYETQIQYALSSSDTLALASESHSIIPYGSEDDYVWPITSDFSNLTITYNGQTQAVSGHCGPTAATGIIGYLDHIGQITIPSGDSTNDTFKNLYIALNTNNIRFTSTTPVGTAWNQVDVGIRWYASTYGCDVYADQSSTNSLSSMKSNLEDGYLLQVGVQDFAGTSGGHSIAVTGYSSNNLYIQNGWNRSRVTYSYSSLDIVNYTYVG